MPTLLATSLLALLGPLLTGALLLYGAYLRWVDLPQKWVLQRRTLLALCLVALLCDAWLGLRLALSQRADQQRQTGAVARAARERFVLPRDFQYGELLVPAGSLVNRRDPFDKGEALRPLALHGLEAVRFAQPVQVAGVWAQALQVLPLRVELAQDQRLGPIHRYDAARQAWAVNPVVPALACKRGQIATFHVPHIPYDVQAEMDRPPPDGPQARCLPGQWLLKNCENGPPVVVEAAPDGTPPFSD
jgi:hypothetical protein